MLARPRWDIEKKILVPFLIITILSTVLFSGILYYSGYTMKTAKEEAVAHSTIAYIQNDIDYLYRQGGAQAVTGKYTEANIDNVFFSDSTGTPIGAATTWKQRPDNERVIFTSNENPMGWEIAYIIDQNEFFSSLLEEQKYTILSTIALLLVIVQSSILIAGNISTPLRRLSAACKSISEKPEETLAIELQYASRKDEIGQLANSFGRMLDNIHSYTTDIVRVKKLNETIVESLPLAVVAYDSEQNEVLINAMAKSLLAKKDYKSGGKTLAGLLADSIENPEMFYDPIRLENGQGRIRDIELGVWRLTDDQQQPWGVLCTMDDVTYKKLLEKRSQQDEKLVYAGKLAASLAHEIRNPLAGIRASVQVVEKRLEQCRDKALCKSIIGEVDRVNLLVENLVDLTRRRELKKSLINIAAFFEELILLYAKVADNNYIAMRADTETDVCLYADETAMKQIFINLINNSIKAMRGGGNIALRACKMQEQLVFTVEDDGSGMTKEKLAQLSEVSSGGEGSGLGTAIVAQLVGQNGGTLRWQSSPGQGTKAVMTFPC